MGIGDKPRAPIPIRDFGAEIDALSRELKDTNARIDRVTSEVEASTNASIRGVEGFIKSFVPDTVRNELKSMTGTVGDINNKLQVLVEANEKLQREKAIAVIREEAQAEASRMAEEKSVQRAALVQSGVSEALSNTVKAAEVVNKTNDAHAKKDDAVDKRIDGTHRRRNAIIGLVLTIATAMSTLGIGAAVSRACNPTR